MSRAKQEKTGVRGYGNAHQKLRRRWKPEVEAGYVACARCGRLIDPTEPWELDHDDDDPTGTTYLGPSHRRCNRATAAHRAARRRAQWSRKW